MAVRIQEAASHRLDEIYRYTRDRWGDAQAERYIVGLFEAFERIESQGVLSRPVPAAFGVDGYFFRHDRHFVYWRRLANGNIGIVTILHERMHQIERFREDFGLCAFWNIPSKSLRGCTPPLSAAEPRPQAITEDVDRRRRKRARLAP